MNIKKTIACMALMISTGYSELMSPYDFEKNLNNAITGRYTFNGIASQEPELTKSREYYKVVEGFVATQFNRNQELLSLAIAAGKFGDNTEFMWTLYNMASMGALRVEGGEERHYERKVPSEVYIKKLSQVSSRKSSEEIDDKRENPTNTEHTHIPVIEEEVKEEKPEPKVVAHEEKPKDFKELVDKMLTNEKYFNSFILEAKTQSDLEYLKSIKSLVLEKNLEVRLDYDRNFSRDYTPLTQYQYINLTANSFDTLIKEQENLLSICDPQFTGEKQTTALILANKVKKFLEEKGYSREFYTLINSLNKEELELMQSKNEYKEYFIGCKIFKYTNRTFQVSALTEEIFEKSVSLAISGCKLLDLFKENKEMQKKIKEQTERQLLFIWHINSFQSIQELLEKFTIIELSDFYKNKESIKLSGFYTFKSFDTEFDTQTSNRLLKIANNKDTKAEEIQIMKENFPDLIAKNKDLKDAIEAKLS